MFGVCFPSDKVVNNYQGTCDALETIPEYAALSNKNRSAVTDTTSMRSASSTKVFVQMINQSERQADLQLTVVRGWPGQLGNCFGSVHLGLYGDEEIFTSHHLSSGEQVSVILRQSNSLTDILMPADGAHPQGIKHPEGDAVFSILPTKDLNLELKVHGTSHANNGARYASPGMGLTVKAHHLLKSSHSQANRLGDIITSHQTEVLPGRLSKHVSFF